MASLSGGITISGANWQGNSFLTTKNQLLSTSAGLYADLVDFNFSTISVSTLTVPQWISTATLYVSDLQAQNINISGILIDASGIFQAPVVSSGVGNFNVTFVSSIAMKGFDQLFGLDVSFDFGLGQAIGGVVGGLGALVGGGLIAVGTGAGLAIQGAETGIATMIAGRPENFISQTEYETINFTSQLQVSTLGNAYPTYSSIFRTVSSVSPNQVPGREIFVSSLFYPGQICVRSASDPFNLITGDSNLNTSTIQSFGQWVPLTGLEPENIEAYSVSTFNLQASNAYIELLRNLAMESYSGLFSNVGIGQDLYVLGFTNLNSLYASSITCETLNVASTFTSTNIVTFFSTQTFDADLANISTANISNAEINYLNVSTANILNLNVGNISSLDIDVNVIRNQFAFVSSLFIDYAAYAYDNATCYLQKIIGSNNAFIDTVTGKFDNLSTNYFLASNSVSSPLGTFSSLVAPQVSTTFFYASNGQFSGNLTTSTFTSCNATLTTANLSYASISSVIIGGGAANFSSLTVSTLVNSTIQANTGTFCNIFISSINNSTSSAYVSSYAIPAPGFGANTTGVPTWLKWYGLSTSKFQLQQPSLDYHLDGFVVSANNPPNYGWIAGLGVVGDNFVPASPFQPPTYKVLESFIFASGGQDAQSATFCLKYGVDYDSNTSQLQAWVVGGANNPVFGILNGPANIQVRAFPF